MLYRISWEHCKNYEANEWERYYQYVIGLHNVGKATLKSDADTFVTHVAKLNFSLKAFYVCLKNTIASTYNQTA